MSVGHGITSKSLLKMYDGSNALQCWELFGVVLLVATRYFSRDSSQHTTTLAFPVYSYSKLESNLGKNET